jgi:hypothetical protein
MRSLARIFFLFASCTILVACATPEEAQTTSSPTFVDSVVVEERNGDYYAIVSGNHPDACSTTGDIEQEVSGHTITITIYTDRPTDAICAQILTPFEEEILLDTGGLDPGSYDIDVNGTVASFTIQS